MILSCFGPRFSITPRISTGNSSTFESANTVLPMPRIPALTSFSGIILVCAKANAAKLIAAMIRQINPGFKVLTRNPVVIIIVSARLAAIPKPGPNRAILFEEVHCRHNSWIQHLTPDKPIAASSETRPPVASGIDWAPIIWFSTLLLISYAAVLYTLGGQWIVDSDVSHGPFVPVVAGYVAWQRRQQFIDTPAQTNYWGLAIVGWAMLQMLAGTLGADLFLQRTSLIIATTGIVLLLGGTKILKLAGLPIFLLLFMIPLPKVIYGQITLPLQLFASFCAEQVLTLLNIPVLREGNLIELSVHAKDGSEFIKTLNVVEACSGIRSLMALSFLGIIYGFFFDSKPWMKWALLVATVPIAITANASRVALTGILTEFNPDLAEGFFHMLEGWVIFVVAGIMLFITHQIINFLYNRFIRKASPQEPKEAPAQ